jgi:RNA polymerase sigma-70 factor (ECF subfamily)
MGLVETMGKRLEVDQVVPVLSSVEQVYRDHVDFVWACLQRFGVRDRDLDDSLQDVFVVVQQRLSTFRGEARVTTWLYSICLRVAWAHRRRSYVRREVPVEQVGDEVDEEQTSPEDQFVLRERRRVLNSVFDEIDLEKRALLVMFEIDELTCEQIASMLGLPIGTVYSRLHSARRAFEKAVLRFRARVRGDVRS